MDPPGPRICSIQLNEDTMPRSTACLLLILLAVPATAQDDWEYSLTPYGWFASLDGTLTVAGRDVVIDESVSEILDNAELAGAVHFEARRGSWMLLADGFFFGAGRTLDGPFEADVDIDTFLGEFAVGYLLNENIAVTGGGRFTSIDTEIDLRLGNGCS